MSVLDKVEVYGGGAGGDRDNSGAGGGGGAYSANTNVSVTPSSSISYSIGSGGADHANGGDTWFGSSTTLMAKGGNAATSATGGAGGLASAGYGTTKYSGGNGGDVNTSSYTPTGGGGCAGPNGAGANGGNSTTLAYSNGGTGGGGANGGSVGGQPVASTSGGAGGNNRLGSGGGAGGTPAHNDGYAGTSGGGGGSGYGDPYYGGAGSVDSIYPNTVYGPGSGGAAGAGATGVEVGGDGGAYCGGGGGVYWGTPGSGGSGLIVITYTTSTGGPLASYDFTTAGTLPSGTSLTRSTTGTYFSNSGAMTTAAINEARWDYQYNGSSWVLGGLLVEPQSSNVQKSSAINDGTRWSKESVTIAVDTSITDIFGSNTASKVTETTSTAKHRFYAGTTTTFTSGNRYTVSMFAKAGTAYVVGLGTGVNTGLGWAVFDLSNGTVSNSGTNGTPFIAPLSNGWYHVGIRGATSKLTGTPTAGIIPYLTNNNPSAGNQPTYTGNTGNYLYVDEVSIEPSLVETSSILNVVTTTIPRAAEQLTLGIPTGGTTLTLTYDDDSTQNIDVTSYAGSTYTLDPATLNLYTLKTAEVN
ncbi:MAG: hypothetical protein EOM35_02245 [Negativicutes bacterium]|nr:hypothetical protein [Negativicutes bacterium]